MYRCSDHDPVVVALNLLPPTGLETTLEPDILLYQKENMLLVGGAMGYQLEMYSVQGQMLLSQSISSEEELVALPDFLTRPSTIIIRLTNNQNAIIRKLILH